MKVTCNVCPHACKLEDNQIGFCNARKNMDGEIVCDNYGKITSMALDPIEKKPLRRFMSGSMILSVGSYGCNLRCPFCQNYSISMANENEVDYFLVSPLELVEKALSLKDKGNIGIAYTYNEPLIGYEFVKDTSILAWEKGLKNVVVSNGNINKEPLMQVLPHIDAMNIDLKGFTQKFYDNIGGQLEAVKKSIELAHLHCHVEVTTLIIPGENDSDDEIKRLSAWLSSIGDEIPLHLTSFYPTYKYKDKSPTKKDDIARLMKIAKEYLEFVY